MCEIGEENQNLIILWSLLVKCQLPSMISLLSTGLLCGFYYISTVKLSLGFLIIFFFCNNISSFQ